MRDAVAGQDDDRPLGAEIARRKGGRNTADPRATLTIAQRPPAAMPVALGEPDPLGRDRSPIIKAVGDACRRRAERAGIAHQHGAVGTRFQRRFELTEMNVSHRSLQHDASSSTYPKAAPGPAMIQLRDRAVQLTMPPHNGDWKFNSTHQGGYR